MHWQVDTVTELHKVMWMETSFPSLVWNEERSEVITNKMKGPWQYVWMLQLASFPLKSLARKVTDTRPPPVPKCNRLELHSRKNKCEHQDR